jgi:Mg2+ and Co2+ transporter CorA
MSSQMNEIANNFQDLDLADQPQMQAQQQEIINQQAEEKSNQESDVQRQLQEMKARAERSEHLLQKTEEANAALQTRLRKQLNPYAYPIPREQKEQLNIVINHIDAMEQSCDYLLSLSIPDDFGMEKKQDFCLANDPTTIQHMNASLNTSINHFNSSINQIKKKMEAIRKAGHDVAQKHHAVKATGNKVRILTRKRQIITEGRQQAARARRVAEARASSVAVDGDDLSYLDEEAVEVDDEEDPLEEPSFV